MYEIMLIRHGMTAGNKIQRYIGKTDEPLCPEGREALCDIVYPKPEAVYVSPLVRCRETAQLLFPGTELQIIPDLAECDFGDFENLNYQELSGNEDYQSWVDSGGTLPFPNGESREEFKRRTLEGFERVMEDCIRKNYEKAALVVHGGTIMNLMESYGRPERDFYGWHTKNGHGYLVQADAALWGHSRKILELIREI